jgi:myo-inositol-1(or 4)-monophosphatase
VPRGLLPVHVRSPGALGMSGAGMSEAGMTEADSGELLAIAVAAAREAGELLASREGRVQVAATKSSPTDVVTEMDRRAEDLIRERILAARPCDVILGEEGGQIGDTVAGGGVRWVIDPLDGTVNYLYGLHDWAVSIAAEVNGEILAGAVFAAMRGELFTAVRGGGAWLATSRGDGLPAGGAGSPQGGLPHPPGPPYPPGQVRSKGDDIGPAGITRVRLHCRPGVPLDQALVATGFGYLAARRKVQGEIVAALLPRVRDVRRGGSASVDLCSVAAGRLDGYYERGLNYWDYAAGALIAVEAGATVGDSRGGPPSTSMTVAAGPGLFGPLTVALAALDAQRDE